MKTLGVLGGVGPQATMDFEARVHRAAQRRIPQRGNSGYPPMVVYYVRHPPVLLNEDLTPRQPLTVDPRLLESAAWLGRMADVLVVTANSVHLFQDELERAAGKKVLSMIEVTLAEVKRRGWRRVGVLGMGEPVVYTSRLDAVGIPSEVVDPGIRARLDRAILSVMEGRDDARDLALAREAVASLRRRGVDGVILGCTEIPLLLGEEGEESELLNPAQLLAEAAIEFALS